MEDIEDGIKKSIQDGVEEDPTEEAKLAVAGKSFIGLIGMSEELSSPVIQSEIETSTDSKDTTVTIGTICETVVT